MGLLMAEIFSETSTTLDYTKIPCQGRQMYTCNYNPYILHSEHKADKMLHIM